jgi:hypothetical protein
MGGVHAADVLGLYLAASFCVLQAGSIWAVGQLGAAVGACPGVATQTTQAHFLLLACCRWQSSCIAEHLAELMELAAG